VLRCEPSGLLFSRLATYLRANGYRLADGIDDCEVVAVNTCCVTQAKIEDAEQLIANALNAPRVQKVVVFGCLAGIGSRHRESERVVSVGSRQLSELDRLFAHEYPFESIGQHAIDADYFEAYQSAVTGEDFFVSIAQGCVHDCSYCNIRRSKGRIRSRTIDEVAADVRAGIEAGKREVVLLADDCGSYGRDIGTDLAELLQALLALDETLALKLSTLFPADLIDLYPRMRDAVGTRRIRYMNIPLQSGSPEVLRAMNRVYDVDAIMEILADVRRRSPDTWLYTHILLDFPTETRRDFEASLRAAAAFDEAMFITYSDNPGTRAAAIENRVEPDEKKARSALIRAALGDGLRGILVESSDREFAPPEPSRETRPGHGGGGPPVGVAQLTLTNRCQCNCAHCGVKHLGRALGGTEFSLAQIEEILDDIARSGFQHVDLFGGEPTLRKDLAEIVRLGSARGLEMYVETNALRLDRESLRELKRAGISRLYVSLDDFTATYHDGNRGSGAFDSAVDTIRQCGELGIDARTSIVPRGKEYFTDGRINEYLRFCLQNGARAMRILFPSYVGNCGDRERIFCSAEEELDLLTHVDGAFHEVTYVESELSPLKTVLEQRAVPCPAKSIFCHIAGNGLTMPCPYLPLAFGDVTRESIGEIFARMLDHPLLRKEGIYCPTRDPDYLDTYFKDLGPQRPYLPVRCHNFLDLGQRCNNNCRGCSLSESETPTPELLERLRAIDGGYATVHLYGGEPFLSSDIFKLLGAVNEKHAAVIHTNARVFAYAELAARLARFRVRAVKVPFFAFDREAFDAHTRAPGSYDQAVEGIANLDRNGVPVCIYSPLPVDDRNLERLKSLGVVSVSTYAPAAAPEGGEAPAAGGGAEPLPDTVMCFGRKVGRTAAVWVKR
jgi:threonylcarbamoyladenosine tRNA methylthiotransferase MtaB